jgi:hypothetical protein
MHKWKMQAKVKKVTWDLLTPIIFFPYYVHHVAHASEKRESVAAMEQDDQKEEAPVKKLTLQERRNLQKGPLSHPKTTALLVINE